MSLPLFVYGTLRATGRRRGLLHGFHRGDAWIRGTLWDLPAGYPAVTLTDAGAVHGEWTDPVPEAMLARLDAYEGVADGLYRRVVVPVHVGGALFDAWCWVMDDPASHGGVPLPGGRWPVSPCRAPDRHER